MDSGGIEDQKLKELTFWNAKQKQCKWKFSFQIFSFICNKLMKRFDDLDFIINVITHEPWFSDNTEMFGETLNFRKLAETWA